MGIRHQRGVNAHVRHPQNKSPKSGQLIGLNSGLVCKHALAVFITRPQADYQIGALHKNNQLACASQTGDCAGLERAQMLDRVHDRDWLHRAQDLASEGKYGGQLTVQDFLFHRQ
jgi:hypothetical protein